MSEDGTECTLADAKALIERMKTIRPTCHDCAWEPLDWPRGEAKLASMKAAGWEESPYTARLTLRCYPCRDSFSFPWADKLDAERVLEFMKAQSGVFALDELKETLT